MTADEALQRFEDETGYKVVDKERWKLMFFTESDVQATKRREPDGREIALDFMIQWFNNADEYFKIKSSDSVTENENLAFLVSSHRQAFVYCLLLGRSHSQEQKKTGIRNIQSNQINVGWISYSDIGNHR